jgi:hypothetical protein
MATVHAVVLADNPKKDKTWNIKFRISHKGEDRYIKSNVFVEKWQLDKKHNIKHQHILDLVRPIEKKYRDSIAMMRDAEYVSAAILKERLLKIESEEYVGNGINFIRFGKDYIEKKVKAGKASSVTGIKTVIYSLTDYFRTESVDITDINFKFLTLYEAYLRTERVVKRNYRADASREVTLPPINDAGLHNHMRDLRLLFNEARAFYNDEDSGIVKIQHYPFKKYKVGHAPLTSHRNRTVVEIKWIRDIPVITDEESRERAKRAINDPEFKNDEKYLVKGSRAEIARDLFMLSFYLVGMNAADLYELPQKIGTRVNYNRSKTRDRRKDKAFISVKVICEARPLLDKYAGKLKAMYSTKAGLNAAINHGLLKVSEASGVPNIDFYDARHTVGSEARNTCGFSFEDIQIALNQKERTVTDIYVAPDWSTVDKVQAALVALLN